MGRFNSIGIVRKAFITFIFVLAFLGRLGHSQPIQDDFFGLHFVTRYMKLSDAKNIVDLAKQYGYTHIVLQIDDGVSLSSFPGTPRDDALTTPEFIELVDYVRQSSMEFIPEIKLLTHQGKLFQNEHLNLMFNKSTYNPSKDEVYEIVFRYLEEVIEITKPEMIHIGHDELAGLSKRFRKNWLNKGEKVLPSDLFYLDVKTIYDFLSDKEIKVGMWGDMLLSPTEKNLRELQAVHGIPDGYGPAMRERLPKDIVIFDWHYHNISKAPVGSVDVFVEDGFDVVASVWDDPKSSEVFINYIREKQKPRVLVTLWYYVQHQKWEKVESIISNTARLYQGNSSGPQ